MKKVMYLLFCFLIALFMCDTILLYIVKLPRYIASRSFVFIPNVPGFSTIKRRPPFYSMINCEDGIKFNHYNNIGLPGNNFTFGKKNVFVLGSSFIEAHQMDASSSAISIANDRIKKWTNDYEFLNLGTSSACPFVLWYRKKFFEKEFVASYVILIVERYEVTISWLKRFELQFQFHLTKNFGTEIKKNKYQLFAETIRKRLLIADILTKAIQKYHNIDETDVISNDKNADIESDIAYLFKPLSEYKREHGEKFIFISLFEEKKVNTLIKEFCKNEEIHFFSNECIMEKQNRINKIGHLNKKGNIALAIFIDETFQKVKEYNEKRNEN